MTANDAIVSQNGNDLCYFMNFSEIEEHLKKIALNMPKIVPQLLEISYNKTQFHDKLIF